MTVSRDPVGCGFVPLHVQVHDPDPMPVAGQGLRAGLDLLDFMVPPSGERIAHPGHMDSRGPRPRRYQPILVRMRRGSANHPRAHAKGSDPRRHFLHKYPPDLARRFDGFSVEDLAVPNMVKNRKPSTAISRTGLTCVARRRGRALVMVDRSYPNSKNRSACGHPLASLSLGTRGWTCRWACTGCGFRREPDVKAAKTIRTAAGLAADACGSNVNRQGSAFALLPVKQDPVGASPPGIPVQQVREWSSSVL
jgi:putative transposase